MNGLFVELDREDEFKAFVTKYYNTTPALISSWLGCVNTIDDARVTYAYKEYRQNVDKFAVLLHSNNPDHYKRSGALLHALYQSTIVTEVNLTPGPYGSVDDLESGFTRVSYGDAEHILSFVNFYKEFYNQILAFELAYRACAAYEKSPRVITFDYLRNVCRYLKANTNLNVDSCFMIFKSLMM